MQRRHGLVTVPLMLLSLFAALAVLLMALPSNASETSSNEREFGHTRLFAKVPEPGFPEGIVVVGDSLFVGTNGFFVKTSPLVKEGDPQPPMPSRIFEYDLQSRDLIDEIIIEGQDLEGDHGLLAIKLHDGFLYAVDKSPPRLLKIHPEAGTQKTVATFPDLPDCGPSGIGVDAPCDPSPVGLGPFPDYVTFDPAGNAYVSDLFQAAIWKLPNATGPPEVFFQDARIGGPGGPNGLAVGRDGDTLYISNTFSTDATSPAFGYVYTLPLSGTPSADDLQVFHQYLGPVGPDGLSIGASGRVYVALFATNQVSILEPDGSEFTRFPTPVENAQREATGQVPYDAPASFVFTGDGRILVTNQAVVSQRDKNWAVLDVWVDDVEIEHSSARTDAPQPASPSNPGQDHGSVPAAESDPSPEAEVPLPLAGGVLPATGGAGTTTAGLVAVLVASALVRGSKC